MTLPPALQKSLEAEEVQVTPLQASVWSEARAGADLLIEAKSGPETTTALAVLVLDRLVAAISSAEAALPRYARKRTSSFSGLSGLNRIVSSVLRTTSSNNNGNSNVKDGESDLSTANGSSGSGGLLKPQLCALVLTKNREVAAGVKDTLLRLGKTSVPNLTIASLVGGIAVSENAQTLSAGCHVAIGTPGRVKFLIDKGVLVADTGRLLVLESADWLMAPVFMEDVDYVVRRFPEEKQVVLSSTVKPSVAFEEGLCEILGVPALKRLDPSGAIEEAQVRMPEPPPSPTPSSALPSAAEAAKAAVAKTAAAKAAATKAAATKSTAAAAATATATATSGGGGGSTAPAPAPAPVPAPAMAVEGRTGDGGASAPPMLAANHIDASGLLSPVGGGVIVPREPRHGSPERAAAAAATAAAAAQEAGFAAASAVALMKPLLPLSQDRPAGQRGSRPRAQLKLLLETRKALSISGATPATALPRPKSIGTPLTPLMQPARSRAVTDAGVVAPLAAAAAAVDTESGLKRRHPTVPGRGLRRTLSIDGLPIGMKFGSGSTKLPARGGGGGGGGGGLAPPPPSYSLVEKGVFHNSSASPDSRAGESMSVEERRALAACNTGGGGGGCRSRGRSGSGQKQRSRRGAGTRGALSKAGAYDDDAASSLGLLSPAASKGGLSAMMVAAVDNQNQKRKPPAEGSSTSSLLLGEVVISGSKKRFVGSREDESPRSCSSDKGWDQLSRQQLDLHDKQQRQQREQQEQQQQQQQQQQAASEGEGSAVRRMRRCGSTASLREAKRNIPAELLASLDANGVTLPTPLQESVWSIGRGAGREDLLVHARPGDETATAYCVPVLERVLERYPQPLCGDCEQAARAPAPSGGGGAACTAADREKYEVVALVLTRTRDMASDVTTMLTRLGEGIPSLSVATLIGGVPVSENHKALAGEGCNVVVGTPGRVKFLMKEGTLRVSAAARTLVLDSADWLMAPVFHDDVGWIARNFPKDKQVLAFSGADPATYKAGLTALVGSSGMTPVGVSSGGGDSGGGDCVSTAMTLDNGEAAAAALTGSAEAATQFSATEQKQQQQQQQQRRRRQAGVVGGPTVAPASGCSSSSSSSSSSNYSGSCEGREVVDDDDGNAENRPPPGTAAATAATATTPSAAGGGDDRGRGTPAAPAAACVRRPPRIDTEAATSRGTVVVGGVVVPPPPPASVPGGGGGGGRKAASPGGPIRTLGMMREESARRAQGLGSMYGIHGQGAVKGASVSVGGGESAAVTDANTNANTTGGGGGGGGGSGSGLPSSFLAKGLKGAGGRDVSLGSSSTTSISSGTPSISTPRARVRSYNENELYGTWFA